MRGGYMDLAGWRGQSERSGRTCRMPQWAPSLPTMSADPIPVPMSMNAVVVTRHIVHVI